ncbi:hypothetical protein QMK19_19450 [Streptomyces sp. H10-C2]|uniref:hypothetical protein n=1 Tax=unclassified Streptomyces TaxID=2593676 RepID=UPI0024B9DA52|nr:MULTISPECIES: hypothetical protein [unclassified Streptomyces]MDJ0343396.1 hypothetical protein [Streptomyces sp. PH10-H1]MDJ0371793.1 hypothetical protein [Streptomyces sp. H10-C2]
MNVRRILTVAAASSALLAAAAPGARALDFGGTLSSTAVTAQSASEQAKSTAQGVIGDKLDKKVGSVKDTVKAGQDAMRAGNNLVS